MVSHYSGYYSILLMQTLVKKTLQKLLKTSAPSVYTATDEAFLYLVVSYYKALERPNWKHNLQESLMFLFDIALQARPMCLVRYMQIWMDLTKSKLESNQPSGAISSIWKWGQQPLSLINMYTVLLTILNSNLPVFSTPRGPGCVVPLLEEVIKDGLVFLEDDRRDGKVPLQTVYLVSELLRQVGHVRPLLHLVEELDDTVQI